MRDIACHGEWDRGVSGSRASQETGDKNIPVCDANDSFTRMGASDRSHGVDVSAERLQGTKFMGVTHQVSMAASLGSAVQYCRSHVSGSSYRLSLVHLMP